MVKVFISVPMAGRSDEDIKSDIERAKKTLRSRMGDVEFADSFYGDDVESRECDAKEHPGLAYLGRFFGDVIPDSTIWRVGTKVEGGTLCYEPNVQMVQMMAHVKRGLHPSDTWNRVYRKNPMTFEMVKRRYKLEEWAQFGKYVLSGNEEKDWHRIDKMFSGFDFYDFVLIRPSTEIKKDKKGNDKFSLAQRRAVYAQKQRMQLPVVRVEDLYKIMDANLVAKDENGKLIKSQSSPTFFKYWNDLYFASDYPCKGDDLTEISLADYNIAMREAQRRAEKKDK